MVQIVGHYINEDGLMVEAALQPREWAVVRQQEKVNIAARAARLTYEYTPRHLRSLLWRCDYCGRANAVSRTACVSCGASMPGRYEAKPYWPATETK
jgi:uncharacterized OB-fold protein